MLVLTRRAGESIMIDNDIELKVLKIRGSQVHLGIDAPKRAAVHRKEVWLRIQDEHNGHEHDDKQRRRDQQLDQRKTRLGTEAAMGSFDTSHACV